MYSVTELFFYLYMKPDIQCLQCLPVDKVVPSTMRMVPSETRNRSQEPCILPRSEANEICPAEANKNLAVCPAAEANKNKN